MVSKSATAGACDGVQIAYTMRGPEAEGALLFCPGLGATQLAYAADAAYFAGTERRTLTFDYRGLGHSTRPGRMTRDSFTLARLADDVIVLLDALGIQRVDVVGHSLGGVVGLELISRSPCRVRSLISYGATYQINWPWISLALLILFSRLAGRKALAAMYAKVGTTREDVRVFIRQMLEECPLSIINHIRHGIRSYNYLETASSWPGPIMLIRGALDKAVNRSLSTTLATLQAKPNFHLADVEGAGHFTNLDKPAEVRHIVERFLDHVDNGDIPLSTR